jgi:hypothetical protein
MMMNPFYLCVVLVMWHIGGRLDLLGTCFGSDPQDTNGGCLLHTCNIKSPSLLPCHFVFQLLKKFQVPSDHVCGFVQFLYCLWVRDLWSIVCVVYGISTVSST